MQYQKWQSVLTLDPMDIKMIIKGCSEQLYTHKFEKLDAMDQFLERVKLPAKQLQIQSMSSLLWKATCCVWAQVPCANDKKLPPDRELGWWYCTYHLFLILQELDLCPTVQFIKQFVFHFMSVCIVIYGRKLFLSQLLSWLALVEFWFYL